MSTACEGLSGILGLSGRLHAALESRCRRRSPWLRCSIDSAVKPDFCRARQRPSLPRWSPPRPWETCRCIYHPVVDNTQDVGRGHACLDGNAEARTGSRVREAERVQAEVSESGRRRASVAGGGSAAGGSAHKDDRVSGCPRPDDDLESSHLDHSPVVRAAASLHIRPRLRETRMNLSL
jgi:hypothetical protein